MGQDDAEGIRQRDGRRHGLNEWIADAVPTPEVAAVAAVVGLAVGLAGSVWVGRLRSSGVRVAYTRKIFHFVVFSTAAGVHVVQGLPGTLVFGTVVAGIVLLGVAKGDGGAFYEALARDKDRPHRTFFIIVPLVTTAVGGLASALLAGPFAAVGYMATGWGDAVGEPVGARWGEHRYKVPSLVGVPAERSYEGSAAVFVAATLASWIALLGLGVAFTWWVPLACGAVSALVEAISNHGLDNLTVQVAASLAALWLVG